MPQVKNKKSKKALVIPASTKNKKALVLTKNTPQYYECLSSQIAQGIKGTNIVKLCKNCKHHSASLISQRKKELKKWMVAYKQLGVSLGKLLKY